MYDCETARDRMRMGWKKWKAKSKEKNRVFQLCFTSIIDDFFSSLFVCITDNTLLVLHFADSNGIFMCVFSFFDLICFFVVASFRIQFLMNLANEDCERKRWRKWLCWSHAKHVENKTNRKKKHINCLAIEVSINIFVRGFHFTLVFLLNFQAWELCFFSFFSSLTWS